MGSNCSNGDLIHQDELVKEIHSRAFGHIKVLSNLKTGKDVGVKWIPFHSEKEMKEYTKAVDSAKEYDNIPTLIKVLRYDLEQRAECTLSGCYLRFEYVDKCLTDLMVEKKSQFN